MRKYLLPESGNFYKANLHCHSIVSDGKLSPAELKKIYMLLHIFAEEREVVEAHLVGHLLDAHVAVEQQLLDAYVSSCEEQVAYVFRIKTSVRYSVG